ncbi:NADPH-dependent F420 reductase [Actinocorallia libanotica]
MNIGILGTGNLAEALGTAWTRAGHEVTIAGRSPAKVEALADRLGARAHAATPREAATGRDAVLLAVTWTGVADMLHAAGGHDGVLEGTPLIDPTNAVEHGVGVLLTGAEAMAERVAALAPGARVVKALHLFPATLWTRPPAQDEEPVTVVTCGDDPAALKTVGGLIRDLGAVPAALGPLSRARQLEEAAGFVIGLVFSGVDPHSALPRVG